MALSTDQYGYLIDPLVPITDSTGKTIKDGFMRVYIAGGSTPVITYRNYDGTANEKTIELDNSGRCKYPVIVSKSLAYKVVVYDSQHSQETPIITVDKMFAIGASVTVGAGATVVTGLNGFRTKSDGFVDASVIGTDGYVALDHTLVDDDLDTDAKATAVEEERYIPLLNEDVNDPDSKMKLGRLWKWVLGKIKSLSTTITAFRTGDYIAVDGPDGTAKMSKDDLLRVTAENVGNDLDASATSAFLPYGKTFALQKSALLGLPLGYVEGDGTIQSSLQHRYATIPLCGIKSISVTLPGGGMSSLYAVVYQDDGGTWNAKAPLNTSGSVSVSIPVQLGGTLYLNYFSPLGDITFSIEYYKPEELFVSKPYMDGKFGSVVKDNAKEILLADKGFGSGLELIGNSQFTFNGGYYATSGWHSSMSHKYVEIDPSQVSSISVTTSSATSGHLPLIVKQSGASYVGYLDTNVLGLQTKDFSDVDLAGCRLFVNAFTTVSSISVTPTDEGTIIKKTAGVAADEHIVLKSNAGLIMPEGLSLGKKLTIDPFTITPARKNNYIASDGTETFNSNSAYFVFDAHGIKSIKITGSGTGLSTIYHAIIEYPNGERQTHLQTNQTSETITIQKGEIAKIYINRFGNISLSWEIEWYTKQEMIDFDTRTFPNVVRKPFNWSTKKVLVVGDSIAKGFINGGSVTAYTWAYWLNQKLGFASLTNGAVGGAAFTQHDGNTIIKSQLEAHHTDDVNLIFVGGGVNDWMRGASYSDVYNAVEELIDYVANNYPANTEIIFITPIEPAGYHLYDKTRRTGLDSLDDIRQAITDAAIANDTDNLISVVDGKTFGFPNVEGKSSFISVAFGDRLHPSELGYRNIYAPALLERIV